MAVRNFPAYQNIGAVAGVPHSIFHLFIAQMLKFDDLTFMAEAHPRSVSKRAKLVSDQVCPPPSVDRAGGGGEPGGRLRPESQGGEFNVSLFSVEGTRVYTYIHT